MDSCLALGAFCNWHYSGERGLLIGGLIQLLLSSYCRIHNPSIWPKDMASTLLDDSSHEYDFIVVGAGSAGSVVARRLAEENWRVLLLDAGDNPIPESEIPAFAYNTLLTRMNWEFISEENSEACLGMRDRKCYIPRGKGLGGSSATNYMLYVRGNKQDYDDWEAMGNTGWGYDSVKKYFNKLEKLEKVDEYNKISKDYGTDGMVSIDKFRGNTSWNSIIDHAWKEMGYNRMDHINQENQRGIGECFGTLKGGLRVSAGNAYLTNLDDKLKENLHVVRNTKVTKVVIDEKNKKANSVLIQIEDDEENIRGKLEIKVKKEIILSAGVIGTPQILMLSGIGPEEHLKDIGITPIIDLPVGEGMLDHISLPINLNMEKSSEKLSHTDYIKVILDFLLERKGPLASVGLANMMGFINTVNNSDPLPDIQFQHLFLPQDDNNIFPNVIYGFNYDNEINNILFKSNEERGTFIIAPTLLKPKSVGRMKLKIANPSETPLLYMEYFKEKEDVDTLLRAVKFVEKLEQTKTFKDAGLTIIHTPLKDCPYEFRSDEYWMCTIKHLSTTSNDQVGTAKMGPKNDGSSVVDPRLRVHGIKGLRVIDASIMPDITRGNTNAPTIMIGEKGADMIKEDWMITNNVEKDEL